MEDITKIVNYLEVSNILIKVLTKLIKKNKIKRKQIYWYIQVTLGTSLLRQMLSGKPKVKNEAYIINFDECSEL